MTVMMGNFIFSNSYVKQKNTTTGGWRKKVNHFVEGGGDFGCREDKIKELLRKMN